MNHPLLKFLYKIKPLRLLAKMVWKNKTINQPFYNGVICFNAVDFGFLWLKGASCEKIDPDIQDRLLDLSKGKEHFIDIGSNVGIMTLAVALRNPAIQITAYDPNKYVLSFLNRSIKKNGLTGRVSTSHAAVSNTTGKAFMNFETGTYSGHLSDKGTEVEVVNFKNILDTYKSNKTLFKMDIEGFEKNLVPLIVSEKNPLHTFVIEIHPKGLNGVSDPDFVLNELFNNKFTVEDVAGKRILSKADIMDWSNVIAYFEPTQL